MLDRGPRYTGKSYESILHPIDSQAPPQQRKISLGPVNGLEYEFTKSQVFLLFNRGLYINLTHVTTVPSLFPRQADCETAASEHRNP